MRGVRSKLLLLAGLLMAGIPSVVVAQGQPPSTVPEAGQATSAPAASAPASAIAASASTLPSAIQPPPVHMAGAQSLAVPACAQHSGFHLTAPDLQSAAVADQTALQLVDMIVLQVGMTANFVVRAVRSGDISAVLCQDKEPSTRYVLYDPRLLANVTAGTANYWTLMTALAHEVGHHVNVHGIDVKQRTRVEQEADFFAGYILARLGAGQDEATAAITRIAELREGAGGLPAPDRLAEVERGWKRGLETRSGGGGGGPVEAGRQAEPGLPASTPSSPPRNAAPPSRSKATITVKADTYLEGEGYQSLPNMSVLLCRESCSHDLRCTMYEYHRPTRTCGLFDQSAPSGPSPEAEVGIKANARAQLMPPSVSSNQPAQPQPAQPPVQVLKQTQAPKSGPQPAMPPVAGPVPGPTRTASAQTASPAPVVPVAPVAPVAPKAPVAPLTPPTKATPLVPAVASWRMAVHGGVYVAGHGYRSMRDTTVATCREVCLSDSRCAMYEFYKPTGGCGLFDHTKVSGASGSTEVGLKTAVKASGATDGRSSRAVSPETRSFAAKSFDSQVSERNQTARLDVRTNVYVSGEGYRVIRNTSSFVCRSACLDDQRCAMYEFYRPNGSCGLFDHTRTAGHSDQAETGIKAALATAR